MSEFGGGARNAAGRPKRRWVKPLVMPKRGQRVSVIKRPERRSNRSCAWAMQLRSNP